MKRLTLCIACSSGLLQHIAPPLNILAKPGFAPFSCVRKCPKSFGIKSICRAARRRLRKNRLRCLFAAAQTHIKGLVGFTVTATVSL